MSSPIRPMLVQASSADRAETRGPESLNEDGPAMSMEVDDIRLRRSIVCARQARRASAFELPAVPHVVLAVARESSRTLLQQALDRSARVTLLDGDRPLSGLGPIDIAVLHSDHLRLASSGLLHDPDLGFPELVFVVDETWSPQGLALRSRGFRYVLSVEDAADWLPMASTRLARLAHARRTLLSEGPVPPPPVERACKTDGIKLHAAETSFREAYLRALVAQCGSRRKAAEQAGVPYRSFCEMLRKLRI